MKKYNVRTHSPQRIQLCYLAIARGYSKQQDKKLFDLYMEKANSALKLSNEQIIKMLKIWSQNANPILREN